jgi:large subunit ribosomal protein L23
MKDVFLLKQPWITEKSVMLNEAGKYVFVVAPSATKNEVKKAIKDLYQVDAVNVNIVNTRAKVKTFRGKTSQKSGKKKAIVTLKPGQKIDLTR